ncbi:UNVERIFIED_CONTAM: 3-isopropylmalate dehydratase large subunit, chloroplastic [Sesamum angustifolium]|uniref:3-isopropylmalate dehydratase large subunit, chloroplastic n=1 Tax=Sesamum angustifolium TaxID=2727405 RepID=A0AAW2IYC6_9LAMI
MASSALAPSSSFLVDKKDGIGGFSAVRRQPPFPCSAQVSKKKVSKKIASVMAPQQSERKPSTTGAVPPTLRFVMDGEMPDYLLAKDLILQPHSPDNRALARECKDVKIDRVYIGSCTGGKTEDFMAAAKLFLASGKKVKVPTFLVPATQKVWMDIYSLPVPGSGGKTCSQIFEEAGCDTPASPSCGACLGGPRDTYARMNEPQASYAFSDIDRNLLCCTRVVC